MKRTIPEGTACKGCNIALSPYEPDVNIYNGVHWHINCKIKKEVEQLKTLKVKKPSKVLGAYVYR